MKFIKEKIISSISVIDINIIDESEKHANHYFTSDSTMPSHIKLILVSNDFINMNRLERHKLVYKILDDEISSIHAISLQLYTESEYNLKNKKYKGEGKILTH